MPKLNCWIEYAEDWRWMPMAKWVHVAQDGKNYSEAERFLPEAPVKVPHKGYPILCVLINGVTLAFSSFEQVEECARVLSMKNMPTTRQLSEYRGNGEGPNTHWLSRLPHKIKSARARPGVVKVLNQIIDALQKPNSGKILSPRKVGASNNSSYLGPDFGLPKGVIRIR